jgi:hypothetical protein
MSTPQEYWDACLIRTWRKAGTVWDVLDMFESITKTKAAEFEPKLLRFPREGFPWKIGVRIFVAQHLSKISARLWEQPPEKDVALLQKLKNSKYDTEKNVIQDGDLKSQMRKTRVNRKKQEFTTRAISERNTATNWNVVK